MSVFRSAIQGPDGEVDPGYLGLYATMWATMGAVPILLLIGLVAVWRRPEDAGPIITALGIAIGGCGAAFAASAGAVGLFRMGDKPKPGTVETSSQSKVTTP